MTSRQFGNFLTPASLSLRSGGFIDTPVDSVGLITDHVHLALRTIRREMSVDLSHGG